MMISSPNMVARRTWREASKTISNRSARVSTRPSSCCRSLRRRTQFSTMMTAPSTMMPKSSAPRLSRLPLTPRSTMPVMANSIDSGMTQAVMSAARMLPRNTNRTSDDQQRAEHQVVLHGRDGGVHQLRAVVDRLRHDAGRQRPVDLGHPVGDAPRDDAAVLAHQHERGAEHDLAAVFGGRAGAQFLAEHHLRHVADVDRARPCACPTTIRSMSSSVAHLARRAHQVLLAAAFDVAGADVGVVGRQRGEHVAEGQPVRRPASPGRA